MVVEPVRSRIFAVLALVSVGLFMLIKSMSLTSLTAAFNALQPHLWSFNSMSWSSWVSLLKAIHHAKQRHDQSIPIHSSLHSMQGQLSIMSTKPNLSQVISHSVKWQKASEGVSKFGLIRPEKPSLTMTFRLRRAIPWVSCCNILSANGDSSKNYNDNSGINSTRFSF